MKCYHHLDIISQKGHLVIMYSLIDWGGGLEAHYNKNTLPI